MLLELSRRQHVDPYYFGLIYVGLGEADQALGARLRLLAVEATIHYHHSSQRGTRKRLLCRHSHTGGRPARAGEPDRTVTPRLHLPVFTRILFNELLCCWK